MRTRPLEKAVEKEIRDLLSAAGATFIKTHGGPYTGPSSNPDILGSYRGQAFAIEVKRDAKAKATPKQLARLQKYRDAGSIAFVAWTLDQVVELLLKQVP